MPFLIRCIFHDENITIGPSLLNSATVIVNLDIPNKKLYMNHMKQTELAKKTGFTSKYISDLKVGRRSFTSKTAVKFEDVTGINRCMWLWPNEEEDPWEQLKNL